MKFLVVFALVAAVATAQPIDPQNERILSIIGAIVNALKPRPPIVGGPEIVEESPIQGGPIIIDDDIISVGPAIVEEEDIISVGPAIVEESIPVPVPLPALPPTGFTSPLVQVIVNVNSGSPAAPGPVETPEIEPTPIIIVEQPEIPEPVIVAPVEIPEIVPAPIVVVDQPEIPEPVIVSPIVIPEIEPTPVIVVEQPAAPEPVIVAPIEVSPVITLPDELN